MPVPRGPFLQWLGLTLMARLRWAGVPSVSLHPRGLACLGEHALRGRCPAAHGTCMGALSLVVPRH